jgi:hypothetical protein
MRRRFDCWGHRRDLAFSNDQGSLPVLSETAKQKPEVLLDLLPKRRPGLSNFELLQAPTPAPQPGSQDRKLSPLNSPVQLGEVPAVLLGRPQRRQPDTVRHVSKGGVCQHGHVPQELVADVGLGRVHGVAAVADVLGGVEGAEGETV